MFSICFFRYHHEPRPAPLHPCLSVPAGCPLLSWTGVGLSGSYMGIWRQPWLQSCHHWCRHFCSGCQVGWVPGLLLYNLIDNSDWVSIFYFCSHISWIILLFTALGVLFVFDPLGNSRPQPPAMEPLGVRDMENNRSSQFFSTARSLAGKVWESRLRLLCCCLPQDESHRAAFSSISQLFSKFFSVSNTYIFFSLDKLSQYRTSIQNIQQIQYRTVTKLWVCFAGHWPGSQWHCSWFGFAPPRTGQDG